MSRERVALQLRTRAGRTALLGSTSLPAACTGALERDNTGLIIGGREQYLLQLRLQVLREQRPSSLGEMVRSSRPAVPCARTWEPWFRPGSR